MAWDFARERGELPDPIWDEEPKWIETYWKAWEIAYRNFHAPAPGSGFVSPFIDAAFNDNIFLWDSCFMTMFCDVAHPLVPGIGTLDNFYARQHPDGEISREIVRATGVDFPQWQNTEDAPLFSRWGYRTDGTRSPVTYRGREAPRPNPKVTLDGLNHPICAWSELEHYRWSADTERLARIWDPLLRYYRALRTYLRQGNGLYVTDWAGMDNSPRNPHLEGGGTAVDISAEMVLFARQLATIGRIIGQEPASRELDRDADDTAARINRLMWSPEREFYLDLTAEGTPIPIRTMSGYWTLLAGVATTERIERLVAHLGNPRTFGTPNPVPTCAADEAGYDRAGGYWRGGVWAPTNTMVIRGLESCGRHELARSLALRHVALVSEVHHETGTIWECYAPETREPATVFGKKKVRSDFVGWSGIGPILFLLEHAIGLRVSAPEGQVHWRIGSDRRCGCRRFRFGGRRVSLEAADPTPAGRRLVTVETDIPFRLRLTWRGVSTDVTVRAGKQEISLG